MNQWRRMAGAATPGSVSISRTKHPPPPILTPFMPTPEAALTAVCDDLLRCVNRAAKDGKPVPPETAAELADRILDIRNILTPPRKQPAKS